VKRDLEKRFCTVTYLFESLIERTERTPNWEQHATHCNTLLQHVIAVPERTEEGVELRAASYKITLHRTASHCNTLQHPATPCNIYAIHERTEKGDEV